MRYIYRRLAQAVTSVISVIVFTFVLIRMIPGGPLDYLRAQIMQDRSTEISIEELNALASNYLNIVPDAPMHVQLWNYLTAMVQGDFGRSVWYNEPVTDIIARAAPWTIFLLSIAIVLTFSIGILLGAAMAYMEGTRFDTGWTGIAMFLNSVPYFIAALLGVYILAIQLSVLPASGNVSSGLEAGFNWEFLSSVGVHAIMPIASLVITGFGGIALGMRGNAIKEIGEEYIRVAHLRGVPGRRIAVRYVGRNAVLPLYTQFMISIGFMFGGSVVLEEIFAYPGLGFYLLEAINSRDYPLMMGIFVMITIAVITAILFADLTYGKIDPRVSSGGSGEAY